jgi:hypothetical protein
MIITPNQEKPGGRSDVTGAPRNEAVSAASLRDRTAIAIKASIQNHS